MQMQAVKLAYGYNRSYADLCQAHGIELLKKRREDRVDKFVTKTLKNEKYKERWFQERNYEGPEIRNVRSIVETRARTMRYYNSPLAYMRRRANELI